MTPTTVMFDYQIFASHERYGGISRYFFELIQGLRRRQDFKVRLAMSCSMNDCLRNRDFSFLISHRNRMKLWLVQLEEEITRRILEYHNRSIALKTLKHQDFDVFHPTYYDPYFLPHLGGKPFVITIHDMIHERFPDYFPRGDPTRSRKRELAEKARHVIAVSESTKRDIVKFYGTPAQKISVIYHASSLRLSGASKSVARLPTRYVLFVGNRALYKGFQFMIRGLGPTFKLQSDLYLLCVGGGYPRRAERDLIKRLGLQRRVLFMRFVSDDVLAQIYSRALAYICPSEYEGFGIPVVEAMSCGCPAVLNRVSSLPEAGGEAARYFDGGDEGSLRKALDPILEDAALREKMRGEGFAHASRFSWDRMTTETRKVYLSLRP
ncbi:MAG: glycosyltransferase family 1 protein [Pseudomonadota bacterium]